MPHYEAKYTTNTFMFDGGAWMPDPEPHKDTYKFKARNNEEALTTAEQHKIEIGRKYFGADVTLDELLKITPIELNSDKKA